MVTRKAVLFLTAASEGTAQAEADRARLRSAFALDAQYTSISDNVVSSGKDAREALGAVLRATKGAELFILILRAPMAFDTRGRVSLDFGDGKIARLDTLRSVLKQGQAWADLVVADCPVEAKDLRTDDPGGAFDAALKLTADRRPAICRRFGSADSILPALAARLEAVATDPAAPSLTALTWAESAQAVFLGDDEGARVPVSRRRIASAGLPEFDEDEPSYTEALRTELRASGRDPLDDGEAPGDPDAEDFDELEAAHGARIADPSLELDVPSAVSALKHRIPRRLVVGRPAEVTVEISEEVMDGGVWSGMLPSSAEPGSSPTGIASMAIRDPENAFDVTLLSKPLVPIGGPEQGPRAWLWRVTPKRWGHYPLILHASAVTRDAAGRVIPAPEENERVHISARPSTASIMGGALKGLAALAVVLAGYAVVAEQQWLPGLTVSEWASALKGPEPEPEIVELPEVSEGGGAEAAGDTVAGDEPTE